MAEPNHSGRSEEHTSELQSRQYLVCRLLLEKKNFLQVALTLILVAGSAIAASKIACNILGLMFTVCPSHFAPHRTIFHVLVGCVLLMLKVSNLKLPVIWLLVSMWLNTLTKRQVWTFLLKVYEVKNGTTH